MKLRVFVPPADRLDPAAPVDWVLLDARDRFAREGRTPLAGAPRADEVEMVLPAERVLFARLALPKVNPSTIRELLPYAVEDRLLADPAHIHAVAGARNARGETLVAVVDREWLHAARDVLFGAGLEPRHAWCESALLAGGRGDWHVVLGPSRGLLVDDDGVGAPFDVGAGLPLAIRLALDEAAARGERPRTIVAHAAQGAALPPLAAWSTEAGLPFPVGDPWETLARGRPGPETHDLLRGEARVQPAPEWPRAPLVLAAILAVLQVGFTAVDAWRLERERRALDARREAVFREAFPEAKVVVDPDLQMARNLAQLRASRGLAAGDDFLAALTRLARDGARPKALDYADGKVTSR